VLNAWVYASAVAPLAGRGDWAAAETCAARARESAQTVPHMLNVASTALAHGRLAAARGDHQGVIDALRPVIHLAPPVYVGEPGGFCPWQPYYADALVSLGRLDEAETVLRQFEELAGERQRRSALTNAGRVRGNLEAARGRHAEAETAYSFGLQHADTVSFPFDRGLLESAYGSFLRRAGRRAAAVTHLQAAQERFAALGARPYLERCERQLVGCGVPRGRSSTRDRSNLTPQELSIATLVASGMSNPEVAAELFLSINTVEFHLKNVYGKLGIRSRSQLRERMRST
jgi:ATP/maltotriose-dependent transcriptional regulator MalT